MTRTKPYGDRRHHLRGPQPAALREPGLQMVVEHAACPCSSGVPPLPALGGHCSLDDVAVQFLVAQTLLEREQEGLGGEGGGGGVGGPDLASKEQQLLVETEIFARSWVRSSPLSPVEAAAATWCVAKRGLGEDGEHRQARAGYKYWPPRRWLTLRFYALVSGSRLFGVPPEEYMSWIYGR